MANVVLRFSIYSNNNDNVKSIYTLKEKLPIPVSFYLKGDPVIMNKITPPGRLRKETSFDYKYEINEIDQIQVCSEIWLNTWRDKVDILQLAKKEFEFELSLNYEITIFEYNYPELYFDPDFLLLLGEVGIVLSFYFYQE